MATDGMTAAERLVALRRLMSDRGVDAYIVPTADCHNSEYPAPHHKRRQYISGFTGSAGTAVITMDEALLWTDGRYFLQAEQQLDSSCWALMKDGTPESITIPVWLRKNHSRIKKVSADSFTLSVSLWQEITTKKGDAALEYVITSGNWIDEVWAMEKESGNRQPAIPSRPIVVQPMSLAGRSVGEKLRELRRMMAGDDGRQDPVDNALLSETQDCAWLYNLRGDDFDYNPMFLSFSLVSQTSAELFCHPEKLTPESTAHLTENNVIVRPYDTIVDAIKTLCVKDNDRSIRFLMDPSVCIALYLAVTDSTKNVTLKTSYVQNAKAKKNPVEIKAAVEAHLEDAKALCSYLQWLEKGAKDGSILKETEYTVACRLEQLRRQQPLNCGLSFPSISSMDSNGAVIHYSPEPKTAKPMTNGMYLIDSGGQYRGGTTDVTRTVHLGEPSDFQRECWTRVLKGHIALDSVIFPEGTKGPQIDILARSFLWQAGLNYRHGTGHGVGAQLSVHEGPCSISPQLRGPAALTSLDEGMILSNEPGYYLDGHFGIRHENLVHIVRADPKTITTPPVSAEGSEKFFCFKNMTMIPYQRKMLMTELLTKQEVIWINDHHEAVWKALSARLDVTKDADLLQWLRESTTPLATI